MFMNVLYKCSFCKKTYDWYEVVYEKPDDNSSVSARVNCLKLFFHEPVDENKTEIKGADGNLHNLCINLCEDCMHKLLDNLTICEMNAWDFV